MISCSPVVLEEAGAGARLDCSWDGEGVLEVEEMEDDESAELSGRRALSDDCGREVVLLEFDDVGGFSASAAGK